MRTAGFSARVAGEAARSGPAAESATKSQEKTQQPRVRRLGAPGADMPSTEAETGKPAADRESTAAKSSARQDFRASRDLIAEVGGQIAARDAPEEILGEPGRFSPATAAISVARVIGKAARRFRRRRRRALRRGTWRPWSSDRRGRGFRWAGSRGSRRGR